MKNLLHFLILLTSLSPLRAFAMERPEKPILKRAGAVEAAGETKAYFQQILNEYQLNSNSYKILAYNDPEDSAIANVKGGCLGAEAIEVNEKTFTSDSFNPDNKDNWLKIFVAYHEVGHIKDKIHVKAFIAATTGPLFVGLLSIKGLDYCGKLLHEKMPKSKLFQSALVNVQNYSISLPPIWNISEVAASALAVYGTLLLIGHKFKEYGEQRADQLACLKLLEKPWGLGPIAAALANHKQGEINLNQIADLNGHNPSAEYNSIVKLMNEKGYIIESIFEEDKNELIIHIKKNNQLKCDYTLMNVKEK